MIKVRVGERVWREWAREGMERVGERGYGESEGELKRANKVRCTRGSQTGAARLGIDGAAAAEDEQESIWRRDVECSRSQHKGGH